MYYDIYGLSLERNAATVERFLAHFCQRSSLDPLIDIWLQIWPHKKYPDAPEVEFQVHSITELIDYAVQHPTHGFSFYTSAALRADVRDIILKFTYDAKVVFGVSIDWWPGDYPQALAIEAEINQLTLAYKSYVAVEDPPADDEAEFDNDMAKWLRIHNDHPRH